MTKVTSPTKTIRVMLFLFAVLAPTIAFADPGTNLTAYARAMNGCRAGFLEDHTSLRSLVGSGRTIESVCSCAVAALLARKDVDQIAYLAANGLRADDLPDLSQLTAMCIGAAPR